MNGHVSQWIPAYHDGELTEARRELVEAHLQACESCRAELEGLENLSVLLQQAPVPEHTSRERFAASIKIRLPRDSHGQPRNRALKTAWQIAPLAVIGMWASIQAALLIASLGISFGLDRYLQASLPFLDWQPSTTITGFFAGIETGIDLAWLSGLEPAIEAFMLGLAATAITGVLLAGWLASWWSYKHNRTEATISK